jgi:hypothetical protein
MAIGDGPFGGVGISPINSILGEANHTQDMWKYINFDESSRIMQAQLAQAAQQAGAGQYVHSFPPQALSQVKSQDPRMELAARAREMFLKRVGGIRAELKVAPGDFLMCHVHGEVVHVFYCFSGRPGVAQEAIDLFPSDQLITQFRMILAI